MSLFFRIGRNGLLRGAACAAFAGAFAIQAAPARAEFSYLTPAQSKAVQCQTTKSAGDYATSLQICLTAAAMFKQLGDAEKRNPWYSYEIEGKMMEAAAEDYAGLKRHQEAIDIAVQAHRLLLYVYKSYKMDSDDYADIAAVTSQLAQLEASERRKL